VPEECSGVTSLTDFGVAFRHEAYDETEEPFGRGENPPLSSASCSTSKTASRNPHSVMKKPRLLIEEWLPYKPR
jgi:hypothetical protein